MNKINNIIEDKLNIEEEIIFPKKDLIKQNSKKYLDNDLIVCPICKEEICYIQPIFDQNGTVKIIYRCLKTEIIQYEAINELKKNFSDELIAENEYEIINNEDENQKKIKEKNIEDYDFKIDRIINIEDYLNFVNNSDNKIKNFDCIFHSNKNNTLYCLQCEKWFCEDCQKLHDELVDNHTFINFKISAINYCENHFDENFNESQYKKKYIVNYYCKICENFFCKYCFNSKNCLSHNGIHNLIDYKNLFKNKKLDFNLIKNYDEKYIKILNNKQNEFFSLDQNSQKKLEDIYNCNLKISKNIYELGKKVVKSFVILKSLKSIYLYQNYLNFLNYNFQIYDEQIYNKRTIYYKTNYFFDFNNIQIYKVLYQNTIESIYNVIPYYEKKLIVIFGKINNKHVFLFVNDQGIFLNNCISISNIEKLTSIIITSNDLLIFGYMQNEKGKIKIHNLKNFLENNNDHNNYSSAAHLNEVTALCEIKKNILLTGSNEIKVWNIKNEPSCIRTIFPNCKIYNMLSYNNQIFLFPENKKVYYCDYNEGEKIKLNINHYDLITSMIILNKNNKNDDEKLLLTAGYDHRIILWDLISLKKIEQKFVIELEKKIININIFDKYICCELINKCNEFILLNIENKFLRRLFYYDNFNSKLSNFTQFKQKDSRIFAITNENDKYGFAIFQSISFGCKLINDITFC